VSNYVAPRIAALQGYAPGEQPADTEHLIKLNTNENPYPPSPRVADAVVKASERLALYPQPLADPLREVAASRYGVANNQVLVGNGSDELLAICLRACACDGGSVAYPVPTYSLYHTLASIEGCEVVEVPTEPSEVLPDALLDANADVLLLCSPRSPYGTPIAPVEVARAAEASRGLVVADEAYVDFGGESALALLADHPNLIVLRSFSKSFSLAGLRLGLALGSADLIGQLVKVKDSYNVSRLAIAGGVAALDDYEWMERSVAKVRSTRARVIEGLREAGYAVPESQANFFWMDCGAEGGREVYERLRARDVLVRFFDTDALRAGVRVTVGTDEQMDAFLAALLG
jgi:histidinol-phosphate aminotransferase